MCVFYICMEIYVVKYREKISLWVRATMTQAQVPMTAHWRSRPLLTTRLRQYIPTFPSQNSTQSVSTAILQRSCRTFPNTSLIWTSRSPPSTPTTRTPPCQTYSRRLSEESLWSSVRRIFQQRRHVWRLLQDICNLNNHQMVHTGEKNFPCHICGKSYNMYSLILFFCPGLGTDPSETFGLGHPWIWQIARTPWTTKYLQ